MEEAPEKLIKEKLLDEIGYSEIKSMLNHIVVWETMTFDEDIITTWIFEDYSKPRAVNMTKFEENAKVQGRLEWLLKRAEQEEGFHRNMEFVDGMIKALREIYH